MTRVFIVAESHFGNTWAVAEVVATGLIESGTRAQVTDVARVPNALPSDLDLLTLGAPAHSRHLPTMTMRAKAREQAASEEVSPGVDEWLETVIIPASIDAVVLDMVIFRGWFSGSAAKAIVKTLQRRQGWRTVSVGSSVVTASKGSLASSQETDVHSWGRELATSVSAR